MGQRCIHTKSGGVLETLENLQNSALDKVFFTASESTDLLPLFASTFPTLGGTLTLLSSSGSDCVTFIDM